MHPDAAELSSLSNTLTDLLDRITAIGRRYEGTEREDVSFKLREAERSLRSAARTVASTARSLD